MERTANVAFAAYAADRADGRIPSESPLGEAPIGVTPDGVTPPVPGARRASDAFLINLDAEPRSLWNGDRPIAVLEHLRVFQVVEQVVGLMVVDT